MNLALFINGELGIRILTYLTEIKEHDVVSIFLNSESKRGASYESQVKSLMVKKNLESEIILWDEAEDLKNTNGLQLRGADYGVSALFGHLLPIELISLVPNGILNLHPSLLPIGRGANPISWNIVEGHTQGVTLHLIDQGLDSGKIIFQQEICTTIGMSAGEIYELAMDKLFHAFTYSFPRWISGSLIPLPQKISNTSHHKASELDHLRFFREDELATFGEFVRRMQATTYSDGRKPIFKDSTGNNWKITFELSKDVHHD